MFKVLQTKDNITYVKKMSKTIKEIKNIVKDSKCLRKKSYLTVCGRSEILSRSVILLILDTQCCCGKYVDIHL